MDPADSTEPWRPAFDLTKADVFALKVDPKAFLEAGHALDKYIRNKVVALGGAELVKTTALAAVYAGIALPMTIYNTTTMVLDSDFTRCRVGGFPSLAFAYEVDTVFITLKTR